MCRKLPHVREKNLELGAELAFTVLWKLKCALIEVVWGSLFVTHFPIFFKKVKELDEMEEGTKTKQRSLVEIHLTTACMSEGV